jgi:hypothetical protein
VKYFSEPSRKGYRWQQFDRRVLFIFLITFQQSAHFTRPSVKGRSHLPCSFICQRAHSGYKYKMSYLNQLYEVTVLPPWLLYNCFHSFFGIVRGGPMCSKPCSFLNLFFSRSDIFSSFPSLTALKNASIFPAG